jgi:hypothetical protein
MNIAPKIHHKIITAHSFFNTLKQLTAPIVALPANKLAEHLPFRQRNRYIALILY